MSAAFDAVESTFGGLDVLVNMAGTMALGPVATLDLADLDRMLRTNVRGAFVVAREATRRVRSGGAIINISTSVVRTRLPTYSAYVASKAAVESMTLILARELLHPRGHAAAVRRRHLRNTARQHQPAGLR